MDTPPQENRQRPSSRKALYQIGKLAKILHFLCTQLFNVGGSYCLWLIQVSVCKCFLYMLIWETFNIFLFFLGGGGGGVKFKFY